MKSTNCGRKVIRESIIGYKQTDSYVEERKERKEKKSGVLLAAGLSSRSAPCTWASIH